MRAIAVSWTPQRNELHIRCEKCGWAWWSRMDRWTVTCGCCGEKDSMHRLREQYVKEHAAMKRYLVFMGDQYYPLGGWEDFQTSCDKEENCFSYIAAQTVRSYDWWQIVDSHTGKIIHRS